MFEVDIKKNKIQKILRLDDHLTEVLKGASIAFIIKVMAAGVSFGLNILLARLLGAEGIGLYFLALTVVTVGMTVGRFGLDNTILRFVAANAEKKNWTAVKGIYFKSIIISAIVSIFITIVCFFATPWLSTKIFNKTQLVVPLKWMCLSIFPLSMVFLHGEAIKGLKQIRDSFLVNGLFVPIFTICGVFLLAGPFGVLGAAWSYTLAATISAVIGFLIWYSHLKHANNIRGRFPTLKIFQSCIPLSLVAFMGIVSGWSATFLLGIWGTKEDIGIYNVALRTSMLTSFILLSVNSIVASKFSAFFANNNILSLERLARQSTKLMTLLALPILLLFIILPDHVMGIFGSEFQGGGRILTILSIGQFINVATGSVGYLLMMTGNEKSMRNATFVSGGLSIIIGILFVQMWGVIGAAVTTAISMAVLNISATYYTYKKINISILPIFKKKYE